MCGIAGYWGSNKIPNERIDMTLRLMHRRGPDYSAFREWHPLNRGYLYFLHSRLNIIDLDPRANQPFEIGQKAVIFNGELYNYLELKSHLEDEGVNFRTTSDTEVLLRSIDQFGWGVLDRFEGMWAFAVYDEIEQSLTFSRDRFGEKPLYFYEDSSGLYFGSEIKFITSLLNRKLPLDIEHLCRYMVNGYKALYKTEKEFFKGICRLAPASLLKIDLKSGRKEERRYWTPSFLAIEQMSREEAVRGVRERLVRSVELRLRSDVPLAFCMSGGVDSNSLISIAKRTFGYDVHGFTIANRDVRYAEQEMLDCAVSELGIRHTSIPVQTESFLERLREVVRYHDAPVSTISYYAHWLLMESMAGSGYRISVSGTGADELFTGYYDHHLAYFYEVRNEPALFSASIKAWMSQLRPFVRNPFLRDPHAFINNPGMRDHIFFEAADFAGYLRTAWSEPFSETKYTESLLRNRMLNEMFHEIVPVILHEDDLNAMYFSVENRSPYLDRELFDFCCKIPARHLIRGGLAKSVLRDAVRGIVPDPIIDNPRKVGFNAPILMFLDVRDRDVRDYLLGDSPIYDHVQKDKIEALIAKTDLPNSESKFLFYFLNCKIFLEEYC